jgi:hypothetical protein
MLAHIGVSLLLAAVALAQDSAVCVNTASVSELSSSVPGVGPSSARIIVDLRAKAGGCLADASAFATVENAYFKRTYTNFLPYLSFACGTCAGDGSAGGGEVDPTESPLPEPIPSESPAPLPSSEVPTDIRFSPTGRVRDGVVAALGTAKYSLDILMYSLSDRDVVSALLAVANKGSIRVRLLLDTGCTRCSILNFSPAALAEVRYISSRTMHFKTAIIGS